MVWKPNIVKKSTVLKMVVIINYFLDLHGNTKDLLSRSLVKKDQLLSELISNSKQ